MKFSTLLRLPLVLLALGVALVISLSNRAPVRLSLDPFSTDAPMLAFELPLYVLIFAALLIGVLIGGSAAWFGQTGWRKKARKGAREVRHLEKDMTRQQASQEPKGVPGVTKDKAAPDTGKSQSGANQKLLPPDHTT